MGLRRQRRKYRDREIRFVNIEPVSHLLAGALEGERPADVLYMLGSAPGVEALRIIVGSDPGPGWTAQAHYLTLPSPVLRFTHVSGHKVEIHRAAAYFGEGTYSPRVAHEAWNLLGALVRATFNEGHLLTTPAATGRYLLARSIPGDREWPVLSEAMQGHLRATTGQGRIQMFGRTGTGPLVQYDGRLAYGALCAKLPTGEPTIDTTDRFLGWWYPARYLVRYGVPRRWDRECDCGAPGHAGIGILPERQEDRWAWPADPGYSNVTWADAREVGLALSHGWRIQILERLLFPGPPYPAANRSNGQLTFAGPLDQWAKKLAALRRDIPDQDGIGELVNNAVRAILLFGIGALHGAPRRVTRTVSADEARDGMIPDTATDVLPLGDRFAWTETEPARWPEMSHPEWTTAIWARARCALLDNPTPHGGHAGMLHVPAETVVGCFTDAIYMTNDPGWADDGRAGRLRRVWADPDHDALPATQLELRRRKARVRHG